jgi:two-component system cell cycle sensor histidine kinase/response regulator CckA
VVAALLLGALCGGRFWMTVSAAPAADPSLPLLTQQTPPGWTGRSMIGVVATMAGLTAAVLGWGLLLRRRIREQTEIIRQRLESEATLEARYRELFENATDMVYTHDLEGNFVSINKAGERVLGYPREVLLKMNGFQLLAPEYRETSRRMLEQKMARGGETTYEVDFVAKDGHRVSMEISTRLIYQAGRKVAIHGIGRDITGRKQNELRSAAFSDFGHRLSLARTPQEAAEAIVRAADELLGWDACYLHVYTQDQETLIPIINYDEVEGQRVAVASAYVDMKPSAMDREVMRSGKKLVLRPPQAVPSSDLVPFGDKGRPSASLMFVPISHGLEVIGILSIQSYTPQAYDEADLNTLQALADHCAGALERIRAGQALRESEQRFAKAFQATPVSVAISSLKDGRIVDANGGFLRLFGFTRDEAIGRTALELKIWVQVDEYGQMVRQLQEGRSIRNGEHRLRTKTDDVRETLVSGEVIELSGELCALLIVHDITDRLHLEAQLRHAQKLEAVGQLAAGVAHDFNNIMTIIQGHASLLLAQPGVDADQGESLQEVSLAADRAAKLTQQLLAFSRKQIMQPAVLDLNQVVQRMVKMLQRLLGENIELDCRYSPRLPAVLADASMMEQIVMNLAVNARDAMPEGGRLTIETSAVEIKASAARDNPEVCPGQHVCLSIADTGCGMDATTVSKIFEPFFTTKDVGKGTGLGLAMAYGIVKQHRGWIEVKSEVGRGTVFRIFLPGESKAAKEARPSEALATGAGSGTILVVEDEE